MAAVTICSDFGAPKNKVWHCFHSFPIYLPWSDRTRCLYYLTSNTRDWLVYFWNLNKWIIEIVWFCVWLFLLNIMFENQPWWYNGSSLFSLSWRIPIYGYTMTYLFNYWWYLGCFHFKIIINNGSINTLKHVLWWYTHNSVGKRHTEGININAQ